MIGVLAPMTIEMRPVVKRMSLVASKGGGGKSYAGSVGGNDVVAMLAGVGVTPASEATERLIELHRPTLVVLSGVAGGIDAGLEVGDLVVPEVVVDYASGAEHRATPVGDVVVAGRMITTDGLLDSSLLWEENQKGVIAVDMETAAVAAVCERRGVPWLAFRAISDLIREGLVDDSTMTTLKPDGSPDIKGLMKLVATKPSVVPRLMKLGRDTTRATDVAAKAAAAACAGWSG